MIFFDIHLNFLMVFTRLHPSSLGLIAIFHLIATVSVRETIDFPFMQDILRSTVNCLAFQIQESTATPCSFPPSFFLCLKDKTCSPCETIPIWAICEDIYFMFCWNEANKTYRVFSKTKNKSIFRFKKKKKAYSHPIQRQEQLWCLICKFSHPMGTYTIKSKK